MVYIKINKVVLSDEITKSKRGEDVMVEAVFTMLEQVMENISTMATAITTGGTLGASKGDNFMGLMGSFGTMFAGMAMMGGAKYDELKNGGEETGSELFNKENNTKEDNRSSKYSDKEIMAKANRNVENEASGRYSGNSGGNSNSSDNGLGVRYNKGRGVPKNFKKAKTVSEITKI